MGWQAGPDGGTGTSPDPGSGLPGGASPARDPRLAWFASVEGRDAVVPSGRLALAADEVSGPGRRCAGATADPGDDCDPAAGDDDGGPGAGGPPSGPGACSGGRALERRPPDLIVPLATLLGLTERPGEVQGFGLLDPALARDMAAAAAASPRTRVCVTVTSPEGYAIGHGCGRLDRSACPPQAATPAGAVGAGLPARLNLTVPVTALASLADGGLASAGSLANSVGPWAFAAQAGPGPPTGAGPPDGYGTWTLVIPGGRRFTARLDMVPTLECDHRYEARGYHPSGKLRHLVQVRDGTFPPCNRHARESDFEHALPYESGGRTCTCNAGARSRACHRVKQSKNWQVTQPRPGWHQWQTPSGRRYAQEPKRYPA